MKNENSSSNVLNIDSFEVGTAPSTIPPASGVSVVEQPATTTAPLGLGLGFGFVAPVADNDQTVLSRDELAEIALEEIGWYYSARSRSKDPETRRARLTIKALLATLPKKRRAAISLTFSKRCPSKLLAKVTTRSVRLLVQLYTKRRGGGVRQLERDVKREGSEVLWFLEERADELFRRAMVFYRRARGNAPSLVPQTSK
jgi:hypothetical protein